jgi:hypothetical protein
MFILSFKLLAQILVERAIITIHGSARNPDTYFKSL